MCALAVGVLSSGSGCAIVFVSSSIDDGRKGEAYIAVGLVCFMIGWAIASVLMVTIQSAVVSVFVCFASHPEALQRNHAKLHAELTSAWHQFRPQQMADCARTNGAYARASAKAKAAKPGPS